MLYVIRTCLSENVVRPNDFDPDLVRGCQLSPLIGTSPISLRRSHQSGQPLHINMGVYIQNMAIVSSPIWHASPLQSRWGGFTLSSVR